MCHILTRYNIYFFRTFKMLKFFQKYEIKIFYLREFEFLSSPRKILNLEKDFGLILCKKGQ